jgi:hypothetical protein
MISALEAAQQGRVNQQRLAQAIEWQIGPRLVLCRWFQIGSTPIFERSWCTSVQHLANVGSLVVYSVYMYSHITTKSIEHWPVRHGRKANSKEGVMDVKAWPRLRRNFVYGRLNRRIGGWFVARVSTSTSILYQNCFFLTNAT